MIAKCIIWANVFLILLPIILGAEYNFTLDNQMITELKNNNADFGKIVLTRTMFGEKTLPFSNESCNFNITKYDKIQNLYNSPIKIGEIPLNNNEVIQLLNVGSYTIKNLSNNELLGALMVSEIPELQIRFNQTSENFKLQFEPSNLTLSGAQIINVKNVYNQSTPAGKYDLYFSINNNTYKHTFTLSELDKFSIKTTSCQQSLVINTHGNFCELTIKNEGNTNVELTAKFDKYDSVFFFPNTVVYPNTEKKAYILYDTASQQILNSERINTTISSKNWTDSFVFNVSFIDTSFPYYDNFSQFMSLEIKKAYNFTINLEDNYNISVANIIIKQNDSMMYNTTIQKNKFNQYYFTYTPQELGTHTTILEIIDSSNNKNTTNWNFEVTKLNLASIENNIAFGKSTMQKYKTISLGYLNENFPIRIKVNSISYNSSWKIKVTNNNNEEFIIEDTTKEVTIDKKGNITISFLGDKVLNYNGELQIIVPEYAEETGTKSFTGEVVDYVIPDEINDENWNGGKLNCYIDDTGDPETSSYICGLQVPLKNAGSGIVPITKEQRDSMEHQYNESVNMWKGKNTTKNFLLFFILLGLFFETTYLLFMMFLYPTLRMRT